MAVVALGALALAVAGGVIEALSGPPPAAPVVEPIPERLVRSMRAPRFPAPPLAPASAAPAPELLVESPVALPRVARTSQAARRKLDEIVIQAERPVALDLIGTRGAVHGHGVVPSRDLPGDPARADLAEGLAVAEAVPVRVPEAIRRHRPRGPDARPTPFWHDVGGAGRGTVTLWAPSPARLAAAAPVPEAVPGPAPGAGGPPVATAVAGPLPVPLQVSSAPYAAVRQVLADGRLPDPAGVRPESFVAAMPDDTPAPRGDKPLAVAVEAAPDPLDPEVHVLRVSVRAADAARDHTPRHLVVLVDASGSMALEGRLDLVRAGVRGLVDRLDEGDTVAVVASADSPRVLLPPTPVRRRAAIDAAVDGLVADGETALTAGLSAAVDLARGLPEGGVREIVLWSDGDANDGPEASARRRGIAAAAAGDDVTVHTVSLATGPWPGDPLGDIARAGGGHHVRVDTGDDARRRLPEALLGAADVVARDVSVDLDLDPARVRDWRLVGFTGEGEGSTAPAALRAGQRVTLTWRVRLRQRRSGRLGTVRISAKEPGGRLRAWTEAIAGRVVRRDFAAASRTTRLAWAAGTLGELLSGRRTGSVADLGRILGRQDDLGSAGRELAEVTARAAFLSGRHRVGPGARGDVAQVVRRYAGQVQYCYAEALARHPRAGGELDVLMRIHGGRVGVVQVERDTTTDPNLQACVVRKLSRWEFPPSVELDLLLPFSLRPR